MIMRGCVRRCVAPRQGHLLPVQGEVFLWHLDKGLEKLPASQYMDLLEEEVKLLREELQQKSGAGVARGV